MLSAQKILTCISPTPFASAKCPLHHPFTFWLGRYPDPLPFCKGTPPGHNSVLPNVKAPAPSGNSSSSRRRVPSSPPRDVASRLRAALPPPAGRLLLLRVPGRALALRRLPAVRPVLRVPAAAGPGLPSGQGPRRLRLLLAVRAGRGRGVRRRVSVGRARRGWGRCATGLECRRRRKGQPGVCACKSRYPVCGSDGLTYPSGCQLRAASLRAQSRGGRPVEQRSKGPCEQGPSIVTPPKDVWNVTGAQIFLSCEVIGIPTPVLTWNKIIKGQYGVQRMELLPGDRDNLAIQTRGGPEKHEVTGWVLISPLSKDDAGEYECHALNSKGEATASSRITVVNSLQEIPTKKGDSAEL
ncbi:insulin-like growth factor-binding protein 7 [Podarcis lilfordi]|uniref:Insulin-like growth factor-binding protein 7 n=1 Tax=Podarcis lilfordi TaxID=74358 RepID=A0AA35LIW6_9SAUR|nr:insulin-like growth factor-binding protein 7 [Podarcis lilfordi]